MKIDFLSVDTKEEFVAEKSLDLNELTFIILQELNHKQQSKQ